MPNGYSGRTLDTKIVTPFLKKNMFPAMAESGWLTRSLEQSQPYKLNYGGSITPKNLKTSFLEILDRVEKESDIAESVLAYLFRGLVSNRDRNSNIQIAKPINLPIRIIISYLDMHFTGKYQSSGASRLPVLPQTSQFQKIINDK